jgi:hypothetical protein
MSSTLAHTCHRRSSRAVPGRGALGNQQQPVLLEDAQAI